MEAQLARREFRREKGGTEMRARPRGRGESWLLSTPAQRRRLPCYSEITTPEQGFLKWANSAT